MWLGWQLSGNLLEILVVYPAFGTIRCANPPVCWSLIPVPTLTRLSKSCWLEMKNNRRFLSPVVWQKGTQTSKEDDDGPHTLCTDTCPCPSLTVYFNIHVCKSESWRFLNLLNQIPKHNLCAYIKDNLIISVTSMTFNNFIFLSYCFTCICHIDKFQKSHPYNPLKTKWSYVSPVRFADSSQ